ncbi:hypothetical protein GTW25_04085 [Aliihoeflea aestuarii]|jgi:hypothetical protein|uniref:hypothetical protein n=1 Tax=Aliihoeflea aestuarii TaxID=453840 RepID=UPI002093E5E8|nr:hypothetical protein [Aliihoeflea aestuarii]MCO6390206.1 hypothetical protein [Aliihoeflea aestuarii]
MDGRTSTDDEIIRDQQEKDLGHPERPQDSLPDEAEKRDGEFEKDKRPGVSSAEQLGDLPPSRNAGSSPEDAVDRVPDRPSDPRV